MVFSRSYESSNRLEAHIVVALDGLDMQGGILQDPVIFVESCGN